MRMKVIVIVIGLSLGASGCSVVKYSAIDLTVPPAQVLNRWKNRCYECRAADDAWKQRVSACPDKQYSKAFCNGFKKGFVEYLDANGTGVPPGMPPACYRTTHSETPAGQQAILDWYAGYREGAAAGQASGLRTLLVVPPSDMLARSVVAPLKVTARPTEPAPSDLPAPRPVPPPEEPDPRGASAAGGGAMPPRPVPIYSTAR